jgi:hypothetical protein
LKKRNEKFSAMKKPAPDEDYPSVHSWNYVSLKGLRKGSVQRRDFKDLTVVGGYCTLNYDYGMCRDPHNYELMPDGSFKERKNELFNPAARPDPYPDGCGRRVTIRCTGCRHFAWCEPDDGMQD